jgi:hypothetical protein
MKGKLPPVHRLHHKRKQQSIQIHLLPKKQKYICRQYQLLIMFFINTNMYYVVNKNHEDEDLMKKINVIEY